MPNTTSNINSAVEGFAASVPIAANTRMPAYSHCCGIASNRTHSPTSGRFRNSSITLPIRSSRSVPTPVRYSTRTAADRARDRTAESRRAASPRSRTSADRARAAAPACRWRPRCSRLTVPPRLRSRLCRTRSAASRACARPCRTAAWALRRRLPAAPRSETRNRIRATRRETNDASRRVIHSEPRTASTVSGTPPKRDTTNSVSPIANRPTASVVIDAPSSRMGISYARRAWPVSLSTPASPRTRPRARLVIPRGAESPNVADTVTKARTISAK